MSSNDPNSSLSNARDTAYPEQVWWFIAAFIALLALFHLRNLLRWSTFLPPARAQVHPEGINHITRGKYSIRRLPITVQETLTILLYRYTVPLGNGRRVNWAEIGVVSGYITVVLTWTFINC